MVIYIDNHQFHYEVENLCRLFFLNDKFQIVRDKKPVEKEFIYTNVSVENNMAIIKASARIDGTMQEKFAEVSVFDPDFENECERQLAIILFEILTDITKTRPSWGIITGIRPVKLMRKLVKEKGLCEAINYFKKILLVSDSKINLCCETMFNEQRILELSKPKSFSLYVSIPFCPTRCTYCSFVSQSIERASNLIYDYLNLLCKEIEYTANIVNSLNLNLETVYIGGGTPTILLPYQMSKLLGTINKSFDVNRCREFTVEAGRPDTITEEILDVLRSFGVNRISINPQTLNDDILESIGRKHSSEQTINAFNLAKKYGFNNINMDLIVGLPNESLESFVKSIKTVCNMAPENITIHTLSMKKASYLTEKGVKFYNEDSLKVADMLEFASSKLKTNDYIPYYLYRQSRMVGNHENVGWAKRGNGGLYNVYIMDETHTILSCGAGAVTKLKQPNGDYLERIFNYKFPYEYISLFGEMIKRKGQVREFYEKFY